MRLWRGALEGVALASRRELAPLGGGRTPRLGGREGARALLDRIAANPLHLAALRSVLAARPGRDVLAGWSDAEVLDELARELARGALRAEISRRTLAPEANSVSEDEDRQEPERKVVHEVEFEITDPFGDPISDVKYVLFYPDGTTKEGLLGADGRVKESSVPPGDYRLALKLVSEARWGDSKVHVGMPVELLAASSGFPEGTAGTFEIYDYRGLAGEKIASVDGKTAANGALEAEWTPAEDAVKDVVGGKVVFLAKIEQAAALSPRVPILRKHEFELKDDKGPLADTTLIACFTSGYRTTTKVSGGKAAVWARVGDRLAWIDLPEHAGAYMKLEEQDGSTRALYLPEGVADDL
ncbi:uncharacterized protein SOCE26_049270 [Sorangium cellulosum]|uniref:Uncharacterized protein n=1 Tax=Sorangium cellulosum TaxID=56 RepID=A0A2L0EVZ9_SORCE|nr:hypothetical protein [Sorangium cellulosum]AUX43478.1 uncharacterized protein SOCE26_049270 [Sorangium cellulosum]